MTTAIKAMIGLALVTLGIIGLVHTFSKASAGSSYTVSQAASDMAANEPTSPYPNSTYDTCVATYLCAHMSPSAVKSWVNSSSFPLVPNATERQSAYNCAFAGTGL